jgi:hypothetical protein
MGLRASRQKLPQWVTESAASGHRAALLDPALDTPGVLGVEHSPKPLELGGWIVEDVQNRVAILVCQADVGDVVRQRSSSLSATWP